MRTKDIISVSELSSAKLDRPVVVTKRGKTLGMFFPADNADVDPELMESIEATLEELLDPDAVKAAKKYRAGKMKFKSWKEVRKKI